MTTDERRAQVFAGLKLMREAFDDVVAEAEAKGEPVPNDNEIWDRTGLKWQFVQETRLPTIIRALKITLQDLTRD